MINFVTSPHPPTPPPLSCADVINVWSLAPQTFKTDYLTYFSVAIKLLEKKFFFSTFEFCGFVVHDESTELAEN